jgi:hypothetical protein
MFGHSVKETDRSSRHVIICETATPGAAAIFGGFAVLSLFLNSGVPGAIKTGYFVAWFVFSRGFGVHC